MKTNDSHGVAEAPVRCKDCDQPNGCPEYCWCDAAGAGKAEYASWFPIRAPAGVSESGHRTPMQEDADGN